MNGLLDRERPAPVEMTVREARDAYLAENGFTVAAYDEPTTKVSLWGFSFSIPNTPRHRDAIMWHDLHHVVTGYGTDPVGEGEISMWELRRGLKGLDLYVSGIVIGLVVLGSALSPRRIWRAWKDSGSEGRSMFPGQLDYETVLDMTVGELRAALSVEPDGVAKHPRRRHSGAPTQPASLSV